VAMVLFYVGFVSFIVIKKRRIRQRSVYSPQDQEMAIRNLTYDVNGYEDIDLSGPEPESLPMIDL